MFKFSLTNSAISLIISMILLIACSCKQGDQKPSETTPKGSDDLAGMTMESIPGSKVQYARKMDVAGNVQMEGYKENDKKTGQWIEYSPEGDIKAINNYVNDKLEGTALRMGFRNQADLKLTYKQGKLDGPWTAYKFGKVVETRLYKDDKLEGTSRTYDDRTFKLKQEVEYKNGLQDGFFRYYDEQGNVTLEYVYKNGEKVSGGIVELK